MRDLAGIVRLNNGVDADDVLERLRLRNAEAVAHDMEKIRKGGTASQPSVPARREQLQPNQKSRDSK